MSMIEQFCSKNKMNYFEICVKEQATVDKFFREYANLIYEITLKEKIR
jgi:hypothetical protein